jgi:hypothetical protein
MSCDLMFTNRLECCCSIFLADVVIEKYAAGWGEQMHVIGSGFVIQWPTIVAAQNVRLYS